MSLKDTLQKPVNLGTRTFYRLEKWLYFKKIRNPEQLTFPDFMCVGVEKAGTTWLYENLKCHPDLFLPERKELNFFSSKYRFYGMPLSGYTDYFKGETRIKGEVTPCSNLPARRIRFIKTVNPRLKIILILRNPVERIWAAALMHLVRAQKKPFESITEQEFYKIFNQWELFSRGDYPAILKNWRSVFPEEQLHICFYDDLKKNPQDFLKEIFQFLNVTDEVDWALFPVQQEFNVSPAHSMPRHLMKHLNDVYSKSLSKLKEEFPEKVNQWEQVNQTLD